MPSVRPAAPPARATWRAPASLLVAAWILLGSSPAARAQFPALGLAPSKPTAGQPAPAPPAVPGPVPAPPPVQAVPPAEIPARIDAALDRLRAIRAQVPATSAILEVEQKFAQAAAILEQMRRGPEGRVDASLSLRELDDLRRQWAGFLEKLGTWRRIVEIEASDLESSAEALRQMRALWQRTRDVAERQKAPRVLTLRVRALLAEVGDVEAALGPRLVTVLGLQDRVSQERASVIEVLDGIERARDDAERRLFIVESRPLWDAVLSTEDWAATGAQVRAAWESQRRALERFWATGATRLVNHLLLLAALLGIFLYQSWRSRAWDAEDASLRVARGVLGKPVSAALVIALVAAGRIHPGMPPVVAQIAALALVVPTVRLLSGFLAAALRPVLYTLAGLYVVDTISGLVAEHTIVDRLVLTAVTALGLVALGWAAWRHQATRELLGDGWGRAAVGATRLAVLALAGSAVLNLVGNVSLANLISDGVLRSAYYAVVLVAAALVVETAVTALLRARLVARLRIVALHSARLGRHVASAVRLAATLGWVVATLFAFGALGTGVDAVTTVLGTRWTVGSTSIALGDVVAFVLVLGAALLLSRVMRFVLEEGVLPGLALPRGVPGAVSMLVRYTLVALGFLLAVGAAGVEMTRFTLLASALGVGVGFGLQNIVNNFISGLILAFERPIQMGDVVDLGTLTGEVRRIGIRSSHVRTFDGADVIVPNANLISGQIVNWTFSDRLRRQEITVGVAYGSDPRRVLEILDAAARAHPDVTRWPEPLALFRGFGSSSLDFLLWCWAPLEKGLIVKSEVALAIHDALATAGIAIPFPQLDLHVRPADGGPSTGGPGAPPPAGRAAEAPDPHEH